jgi:SAM-dependent methyltransferase
MPASADDKRDDPGLSLAPMRDTDKDWKAIGEAHPYFGVFTNESLLNPDDKAIADLFENGRCEVEDIFRRLCSIAPGFAPKSALDFGCGVGRLLIPISKKVERAVGVDVSDGMLRTARRHIAEAAVTADLVKEIPSDQKFDWINSVIVFQHIPPRRGYGLLRSLWDALNAGGCLSLQITIFHDRSHTSELQADLDFYAYDGDSVRNLSIGNSPEIGMRMYDYDLAQVLIAIGAAEFQQYQIDTSNHAGCHGAWIFVQKR